MKVVFPSMIPIFDKILMASDELQKKKSERTNLLLKIKLKMKEVSQSKIFDCVEIL